MGRPFAALIKLGPELKPEFDFGQPAPTAKRARRWISPAGVARQMSAVRRAGL